MTPRGHQAGCIELLQWALPQLHMRWDGFRTVRNQVCKRLGRRIRELSLSSVDDYRAYLETHPGEWTRLDSFCRITISSFYRNREVFDFLSREILPALVELARRRGDAALRVWSAGCGAGEEPYTFSIVSRSHPEPVVSRMPLEIIGTDIDGHQLDRARRALYPQASARNMPAQLQELAFEAEDGQLRLRSEFREKVDIRRQDLRFGMPAGPFHLIFCRNLLFTYFDSELQHELGTKLVGRLVPEGVLVLGKHEVLPQDLGLEVVDSHRRLYRRPANQ